ncbi:MAG: chemotaxis protein CheX [Eubacterium sp.]|nr:chemotaxis protein CheX [Eubacterium sp.]
MFSQFMGNYLIQNGHISQDQFNTCMEYMKANRVKLGLLAETEGLLTRNQSEELNRLQMQSDKRFGDLAIEKGYLTETDIDHLLQLQGSPYLIFIQALEENSIMSREKINNYVLEFQKDAGLTNTAMEAIKSADIDNVIPAYVNTRDGNYMNLISLALRNIVRFVSTYIRIDTAELATSYSAKYIALQRIKGDFNGFLGFASNDDSILTIANGYAGEYFEKPDEDALDSVCEFTNCINGLHATELSYEDVVIDMLPPEFKFDETVEADREFFVVPVYITGKRVDMIVLQ